jgi:hypothetical protein
VLRDERHDDGDERGDDLPRGEPERASCAGRRCRGRRAWRWKDSDVAGSLPVVGVTGGHEPHPWRVVRFAVDPFCGTEQ